MIRRADKGDIAALARLLSQVLEVHHEGRPDLFKSGVRKYTDSELEALVCDDRRPVFVHTDDKGEVIGYAFCIITDHKDDNILTGIKTLYIDDLCVDEAQRGKHIGKSLYEYVLRFAEDIGCYNVTLNVWACNEKALGFYRALGLLPQKYGMEKIL